MCTWISIPMLEGVDTTLVEVNERLAVGGLSISLEDAQMLGERRAEALAETERVEFGPSALVAVAEAVATSPCLTKEHVARDLAELLSTFYALRDELPLDVPDTEIAYALRGCLDAWGSVSEISSLSAEEIMSFSDDYVRATEAEGDEYRITDDEGRTYSFDPDEWDDDVQADGWNGERWADDWND